MSKTKEKLNQEKKIISLIRKINLGLKSKKSICKKAVDRAILSEVIPAYRDGKSINRLMIILRGRGCSYAMSKNGPCTMCGLLEITTKGKNITQEDYLKQFLSIYKSHDFEKKKILELDLFNAGSFFDKWQITPAAREGFLKIIAKDNFLKYLLVDSRAKDITLEKIKKSTEILGDKILEVGIGLESANDFVRNVCLNKGLDLKTFEKACKILKKGGAHLVVYLLFKPPFLTEKEAINDAVNTIKYVFELSVKLDLPARISLEPACVQGSCLLVLLYKKGLYHPPWLWSVIEVLKQVFHLGEVRVGIPEEDPVIVARRGNKTAIGKRCPCSGKVEKIIEKYNKTLDIKVFQKIPKCKCQKIWKKEIVQKSPQLSAGRILKILSMIPGFN